MHRLGIMGGTFDPIHLGHLAAARHVRDALELNEVLFIPAGSPWQKAGRVLAPREDRWQMVLLGIEGEERMAASRIELDRPGFTYSVDTLARLAAERGAAWRFVLIVGADALARMPTWRDPARLLRMATVAAVTRPGTPLEVAPALKSVVSIVEAPGVDVSSTECRALVARGESLAGLVPLPVAEYIASHDLYRELS